VSLALRHGKLPAYGRELLAMREAGEVPADPVLVTDCWPLAHWFRDRLEWCALVCDPPERRFDLSPVHSLDVVAVFLGEGPPATARWPFERDDAPPRWVDQVRAHAPKRLQVHDALAFARDLEQILFRLLETRPQ
jgi:hypothetical protein